MRRRTKILMGLVFGAIIMMAAMGLMMNTQIGASLWQFDYEWTQLHVNGKAQGYTELPGEVTESPEWQEEHICPFCGAQFKTDAELRLHIAFAHGPVMDVRTSYEWWVDIDGAPIYDGTTWNGLLPDVGVVVSAPWRTDKTGDQISYDADAPITREWTSGDTVHRAYLYYYAFDVLTLTKQDAFTVPGTAQSLGQNWVSHEAGVMEIESLVTVQMRKGMFSDVSGEFMDARILDVETTDLQLQSGLNWVLAPSVAVQQDKNARVPVQNRDYGEDYYNCQLQLYCTLTPGLAKEELGFDVNKYEVWCRKTVQMELMLTEHLTIGEEGGPIDPLDPPIFLRELSLFEMIVIVLILIVVIVALIVVFRVVGVVGSFAELGAKLKGGR